MKIGALVLDNNLVMAPLSGISNLPFRLLARGMGCALVCSEMVSAHGLIQKSEKTEKMLCSDPKEKPLSIQIFGADPDIMAEAARIVESKGASILDINFGCSVKKVIKTGAGAALMKTPKKVEALIKAVRKSITIPLTVKMRSGWDRSGDQALRIAEIADTCGVNAVIVHPRVATQGFGGTADWSIIGKIKKAISIPVIGNGDIKGAADAILMQNTTGCDGIMIGRGAIGNPWLFSQILSCFRDGEIPSVSLDQRFAMMKQYVDSTIRCQGEKRGCHMMRSRLGWFVKGLPGSSKFRESIKRIASEDETIHLIKSYLNDLQKVSVQNPTATP
ncbi:MAG: tRNA dihydrouridine synthase DusB [Desulfobacterales bacterium]|jgi:nifR3 family TIM-barrel protein|nr:tRNA dihydrouridine synthase DusB [Desulfobacterales bacterium]